MALVKTINKGEYEFSIHTNCAIDELNPAHLAVYRCLTANGLGGHGAMWVKSFPIDAMDTAESWIVNEAPLPRRKTR